MIYLVSFAKEIQREVWRDGHSERRDVYIWSVAVWLYLGIFVP